MLPFNVPLLFGTTKWSPGAVTWVVPELPYQWPMLGYNKPILLSNKHPSQHLLFSLKLQYQYFPTIKDT
uniref:Ovule protein n=1 Tax=Romanomermis culicivorax TaxID=13658 RepID=A0A915K8W9_ROMCU